MREQTVADATKDEKGEAPQKIVLTKREIAARQRRMAVILRKADAMPIVDHRSADEIIGYNEHGHFD
jgi:hypothetical protein